MTRIAHRPLPAKQFAEQLVNEGEDAVHDLAMALREAQNRMSRQMAIEHGELMALARAGHAAFDEHLQATFAVMRELLKARTAQEAAHANLSFVLSWQRRTADLACRCATLIGRGAFDAAR